MDVTANPDTSRITIIPGQRSGQPCIRGLRVTVWDVLDMLASGITEDEILEEYPYLQKADFPAVYAYVSRTGRARNELKLLFDANLSPKLGARLRDLFPGSTHVFDLGMAGYS